MTSSKRWTITTELHDLEEGLFGQIVLWVFEILPLLEQQGQWPAWQIRSQFYGLGPERVVIPGVFDLAYDPGAGPFTSTSLLSLRSRSLSALGNDWQGLHQLWHRFFKTPARIEKRADEVGLPQGTLGLHYRGTDKNQAVLDTNAVSHDDMLDAAAEALALHPRLTGVFLATDEVEVVERAQRRFPHLRIINLGGVSFHKSGVHDEDRADRALLDCVLLSRCDLVLKCSSALSGFAKVLNPDLQIFRVAASKFFYDVPYFPDAYIPRWEAPGQEGRERTQRLFDGDWMEDSRVPPRFRGHFTFQPRYEWLQRLARRMHFLLTR